MVKPRLQGPLGAPGGEFFRTLVDGHLRPLVAQLLQVENLPVGQEGETEGWLEIITSLSWEAATLLKPDMSKGGGMDPGGYVKVKCIASGSRCDSMVVKGVVCKKNVAHRRMTSKIEKPRFMILGGALEYQHVSNLLSSFDTLLQQEMDHLKMAVAKVDAHHPDVLLVEKSVSRLAQEYLLAKGISLVLNIKRPLLERIARCTGAQIVPSIDHLSSQKLGYCDLFHVERFMEDLGSASQGGKKLVKTLMYFEGCPKPLGCTILLRGANGDELKKLKHVVQYGIFAAYHLALETSFLADEGATLPELPLNTPITKSCSDIMSNHLAGNSLRSLVSMGQGGFSIAQNDETVSTGNQLGGSDNSFLHEDGNTQADEPGPMNEEFPPSPSDHQSILVSLSSWCVWKGTVCERLHLFRIKYYGSFDKPLGRFLQDHLFDQSYQCNSCEMPSEAHVHCYTHRQGTLTISIKKLPEIILPGEREGKIWMWHRCLKCPRINGFPPATRRIVMSDAAFGLSFGKFLELSFSNHAAASRVASCGHSLHRDCLHFYGFGKMVACFRYASIYVHSIYLPPAKVDFNYEKQEWIQKETVEVIDQAKLLFSEVLNALRQIAEKSSGSGSHSSAMVTPESRHQIVELEGMLQKEKVEFEELLEKTLNREAKKGQPVIDILEINRLRRQLLFQSYMWDHRLVYAASLENNRYNDGLNSSISDEGKPATSSEKIADNVAINLGKSYNSCNSFLVDAMLNKGFDHGGDVANTVHAEMLNKERDSGRDSKYENEDQGVSCLKMPFLNFYRGFNKNVLSGAQKLDTLGEYNPVYVSSFRELELEGGPMLLLPVGINDTVVPVYDDEPTSLISYALVSPDYHSQMSDEGERTRNSGDVSLSDSFTTQSHHPDDDTTPESHRSFGSTEESLLSTYGSPSSLGLDPLSYTKALDAKVSFGDDSPLGQVKYSVTCYHAKRFEALRRICCPSELDYVRSLSRCKKWGAQGGKSKVFFAKSLDDRFIIKQVTKTELESFIKFAPDYFKYLSESIGTKSPTCLAKILGIYQVESKHLKGGKESKIDVLVMENLMFGRNITRLYDLKGSSRSRYNPDSSGSDKVLLDQNLIEAMPTSPIFVGNKAKRLLEMAVWNDTAFLASIDVMDYSLLVGVDEEKHELVLGIIDFMRQYTWDKHLETCIKASGILGGPKNASPTVISPEQYKKRFRKAMTTYFLMVPDQWSPPSIVTSNSQSDLGEETGGNSVE